jgi:lysophospholipase L1-like esterase
MKSKRFCLFIPLKAAVFLVSFLAIISCKKQADNPLKVNADSTVATTSTNNNNTDSGKITYLALGDSYTIGQSVSKNGRFPVQLINMLQKKNANIENADIIAVTGWTTADLLNALKAKPVKNTYTFVTLLIGVNNQYQGRTLGEYKKQFSQLIDSAIHFAGNKNNHVFVLSIPDYSVNPFARGADQQKIAAEINEFNAANKLISQNTGVQYLDITGISREAKNDPGLIAPDGLHPSSAQYLQWDQLLAPFVLSVINK